MFEVHISKHSLFRLKITVGCLTSTYPSIQDLTRSGCRLLSEHLTLTSTYPSIHLLLVLELSRSRSVARCAQIQAFATKTCTRVGLLGPSGKHAACGHVHPCCRLCLHEQKQKRKFGQKGRLTKEKNEEGTFYYRNISGEGIIFITVLNKIKKIAAGENYSHYSFIFIRKQ